MYKVAICDDDAGQCSELEAEVTHFFEERAENCEVESWYSADTLCRDIKEYDPQLLFLDIELPEKNGVYVGRFIRDTLKNDRMNIIFISHKTSYAMELFQIHPYDFFVKPIDKEILYSTLIKIMHLREIQKKEFRYTYKKIEHAVPYGEILYFSSRNKKITINKTAAKLKFIMENFGI